jgi:hypothetical protein
VFAIEKNDLVDAGVLQQRQPLDGLVDRVSGNTVGQAGAVSMESRARQVFEISS